MNSITGLRVFLFLFHLFMIVLSTKTSLNAHNLQGFRPIQQTTLTSSPSQINYQQHQHRLRNLQSLISLNLQLPPQQPQKVAIKISSIEKSLLSEQQNQIFEGLPTEKQLTEMAMNAYAFGIAKTVQVLVTMESISCQNKLLYLSQLKGIINKNIIQKIIQRDRVESIEKNAQQQIKVLLNELKLKLQQLSSLNIDENEEKMNIQIQSLKYLYQLHNEVDIQLQITKNRVKNFKDVIENKQALLLQLINERKALLIFTFLSPQDQNKIQTLNTQIQQMEGQLALIKNDYLLFQTYLGRKQIESDSLRRIYEKLQVQIERNRQQLLLKKAQKFKLRGQVNQINQQLGKQRLNLHSGIPQTLNEQINMLENSLPSIYTEFDIIHYSCHQLNLDASNLTYQRNIDRFLEFVKNVYSIDPEHIYDLDGIQQVLVIPIDIFSSRWKQQYGQVTEEDIIIVNVLQPEGQEQQYNFSCLRPSSIISGSSSITNIFENCILLKDQNEISYNVHAGICRQVGEAEEDLSEGRRIFWKGNNFERVVDVSTGQCV